MLLPSLFLPSRRHLLNKSHFSRSVQSTARSPLTSPIIVVRDKSRYFFWIGSRILRMIIQKGFESHQVLAISQTAHAWVSGQLARQWGNEESQEDRQRIAEFLQEQKALQQNLLGSLRKDPYLRSSCSDRAIEYNQKLLAAWDRLSIELCRNPEAKFSVDDVPTALGKSCRFLVTPVDQTQGRLDWSPGHFLNRGSN